jgi:small-conductance mechanosensitive channel
MTERIRRPWGRRLVAAGWMLAAAPPSGVAWAQTAPPSASRPQAEAEAAQPTAAVTLDGAVLFRVRGVSAFPAAERARGINDRLRAAAADPLITADLVRLVPADDRTNLLTGSRFLMGVVDADGALEGIPRSTLAAVIQQRIAMALEAYHRDRTPAAIRKSVVSALVATVLALGLGIVLRWLFGAIGRLVERRLASHLAAFETKSFQIVRAEQLGRAVLGVVRGLRLLAMLAIGFVWLQQGLGFFPWTRGLSHQLAGLLLDPLRTMTMAIVDAIPGLVFIVLLVMVTRWVLRATHLLFSRIEQGGIQVAAFDREWAIPTYRIVRILLVAFAFVVAYPYVPGSGSEAFKGVSIFIGVVFSLGSSSFISNIVAGYTMTYRRAFSVGDRIRIGEVMGDVTTMRAMVTHVRTPKNEEVVVPNSEILGTHVINYSTLARQGGLILHTTVGIGYETPWRQVEAMLQLAAGRTEGILREPPPFILLTALGDFAVTYELNVYCDAPQQMPRLYAALHRNILDAFNESGVQIMTPAYEGDPAAPKVVPRDQWFTPPSPSTPSPSA